MANITPVTAQGAPNFKPVSRGRNPVQSNEAPATSSAHTETSAGEPRLARIARRAHELYEARGHNDGRDFDDWLQAEREIDGETDNQSR